MAKDMSCARVKQCSAANIGATERHNERLNTGYANVNGVYTPQTTSAAQAAKASTIPQTSDDMPIVPIVVISIAALLGLGVTAYLKKKQN